MKETAFFAFTNKTSRRFLRLGVLFLLVLSTAWRPQHDYHVSLIQLEYKAKSQRLQVSMKIFTDDLEKGISHYQGQRGYMDDFEKEDVCHYVQSGFKVRVKGKEVHGYCLGYEGEADAQWVYLEYQLPKGIEQVQVTDQLLFAVYDDQQNILRWRSGDYKDSHLAVEGAGSALFNVKTK